MLVSTFIAAVTLPIEEFAVVMWFGFCVSVITAATITATHKKAEVL